MTEQEMRLADYRRQVEAKDAEIRALSAHEHALFESLRRCRRVIDVLLERLEPGPKPEPGPGPEPGPEPKPVARRVMEVTVRLKGNGTDPLVGAELAIYLEHGVQSWLGTVTRVEERDADE